MCAESRKASPTSLQNDFSRGFEKPSRLNPLRNTPSCMGIQMCKGLYQYSVQVYTCSWIGSDIYLEISRCGSVLDQRQKCCFQVLVCKQSIGKLLLAECYHQARNVAKQDLCQGRAIHIHNKSKHRSMDNRQNTDLGRDIDLESELTLLDLDIDLQAHRNPITPPYT